MTKRKDNLITVKVETEKAVYAVTLERLNNGTYGQPRYKAAIVCLIAKADNNSIDTAQYFYTACYTFTGHYCGDKEEAAYIVKRFENNEE
jgi:hypothetical protein